VCSSHFNENSLNPPKRAPFNSHPVAHLQERPRFVGKPRHNHCLDGTNLGFVHRHWSALLADDLNDARSHEDRESVLNVQSAEQITGKQRSVDDLDSI